MIDLDDYLYFPALMSRVAEITGLRHLDQPAKGRIVPLFTLGRWHNSVEFDRAIENCAAAMVLGISKGRGLAVLHLRFHRGDPDLQTRRHVSQEMLSLLQKELRPAHRGGGRDL